MIVIIDYHMGNIKNVSYALHYLGYNVKISDEPETIKKARGLILPGVGAFHDAVQVLREKKLDNAIKEMVEKGKPFLGICLGMQLLFSYSEENGRHQGLGLMPGRVVRFSRQFRVPHLGWNQVKYYSSNNEKNDIDLFSGIQNNRYFYFLHSYYCVPEKDDVILAQSDYHGLFVSAVCRKNVFGVQFHPEKSSTQGLNILNNFGEICNADYSGN